MNISRANKPCSLFHLFYTFKTKPRRILLKVVFIPELINNLLASCPLINVDFLLSHNAHIDKITSFPFLLL